MPGEATARASGRRVALLLEYDGTAFSGSQYQENGRTVQGELESAINNLTGETLRCAFAGRTDAGVHALGQVAAFDTASLLDSAGFVSGLNHFLANDVAVLSARDVTGAFDPRRDALSRVYRYRIVRRATRSPLLRHRAWQVAGALDAAAMQREAARLVGTHDFAAFAGPYDGGTVRTLDGCDVRTGAVELTVEMEARAFLPHQVRRTVGALVEVGLGRRDGTWVAGLLSEAAVASAGPTAPACGLYLVSIAYDGVDFGACVGMEH